MKNQIEIQKITIRDKVEVRDEKARMNLKKLLSRILEVDEACIEMRFEDRSTQYKPEVIDKYHA